jgi:CobW/HypB/UreG family nucleotide-binding protein
VNVPTFVVVGGMLGAGKTSLIVAAARKLAEQGRRVGVVTNDQGSGLVDTALVRAAHVPVAEVSGGCFCCRLSDLLSACDALAAERPEVIFAEPVGSCVDLAATVLRPLLRDEAHRFRVAPLTVLVDPARAIEMTVPRRDADVAYLFRQQLDEADIVCFTKADAGVEPPALDGVAGHAISAKTGQGVEAWLDHVLAPSPSAGSGLLAVDYTRYAEAEAALAWLNWRARVDLESPQSPAVLVGTLTDRLETSLDAAGLSIVHVKVLDRSPTGYVRASVCARGAEPVVEGTLDASPASRHDLTINARAIGDPAQLSRLVAESLESLAMHVEVTSREAFRPSPPRPERRA